MVTSGQPTCNAACMWHVHSHGILLDEDVKGRGRAGCSLLPPVLLGVPPCLQVRTVEGDGTVGVAGVVEHRGRRE